MPTGLGGGRTPAFARRQWVAGALGADERLVDDARRELLADVDGGGPWLSRSKNPGRKRSVKHVALRLPAETGEPDADVPSWTLDLVHAGRRRPSGRITADAWRAYARMLDRADLPARYRRRDLPADTIEATVKGIGALVWASADTGRRRLRELEAVGLVEVTERPGGWLRVRVVQDPAEAERVAQEYAEQGRKVARPRRDPLQQAPLTPGNKLQSPLAGNSTPQESHPEHSPQEESSVVRPVTAAHVGDARGRETAPHAAQTEEHSAQGQQERGGSAPPVSRRAERHETGVPTPVMAKSLLSALPRQFRDGAPAWVIRRMTVRIGRMIDDDGHTPAAILAAGREIAAARPINGDHIAALRAVRAALVANEHDPEVCGQCGGRLFNEGGVCPACDGDDVTITQEQIRAVHAQLGIDQAGQYRERELCDRCVTWTVPHEPCQVCNDPDRIEAEERIRELEAQILTGGRSHDGRPDVEGQDHADERHEAEAGDDVEALLSPEDLQLLRQAMANASRGSHDRYRSSGPLAHPA